MQQIRVVDYDSQWPRQFAALRTRLEAAVGAWALSIEHVGSTSVPGLAAKPILDIDIVIASSEVLPQVIASLAALGYSHVGDRGVPGREAFKQPDTEVRHHLYVCLQGCSALANHLTIRDHLRSHPEDVKAYGDLKKQLAETFTHDIDGYVDGKTELLVDILARAGFSQAWLDEIRGINQLPSEGAKSKGDNSR